MDITHAFCWVGESGGAGVGCNQLIPRAPSSIFCNLMRTPSVGGVVGPGGITLSGSLQAAAGGYIGTVASEQIVCQYGSGSLAPASPSACNAGNQGNGGIINTNYFTAAVLASPIQVQTGQTVAVTVNISFS